jgi:metal-sensitive transcriptional repressor
MHDRHIHQSHPDIVKRLKRAEGHLRRVISMVERVKQSASTLSAHGAGSSKSAPPKRIGTATSRLVIMTCAGLKYGILPPLRDGLDQARLVAQIHDR